MCIAGHQRCDNSVFVTDHDRYADVQRLAAFIFSSSHSKPIKNTGELEEICPDLIVEKIVRNHFMAFVDNGKVLSSLSSAFWDGLWDDVLARRSVDT